MGQLQHRIRAAAIVINDNKILLVKHRHPKTGFEWWVPPGGGLKDRETIYDCAKREAYEETGLLLELGKILYIREYVETEKSRHHLEIFILAESFKGNVTIENVPPLDDDAPYITEARFLSEDEMRDITVYPEILKAEFWQDIASGRQFELKYLGQQMDY